MDTATLLFFEQQPEALPLYEAFAGAVMDQYPTRGSKYRNHRYPFQTGISLPAYLLPG